MKEKIKPLLNSIRFWLITITAIFAVLKYYGIIPTEVQEIILGWVTAVVGIGSVDKVTTTLAGSNNKASVVQPLSDDELIEVARL